AISLHHGEIILHADGAAEVRDRGSRSGTFVNDQRIQSHVLRSGDRLAFGPLHATFRVKNSTPSTATTRIPLRSDTAQREAQAALDSLSARSAEKAAELEKLIAQTETARSALDALTTDTDAARARLTSFVADADRLEVRIRTLTTDAEQAQSRRDSLHAEADKAQARLHKLNADADKAQSKLDALNKDTDKAQSRLDALNADADKAQTRLDALTTETKEAQSRLEGINANTNQAESRLAILASSESEAQNRLSQLQASIKGETERLEAARRDLAQAEARLQDAQSQAAQNQARVREAEESLAILQKAVVKTEEVIGVLQVQHDEKAAALEKITQSESQVKTRAEAAQRDLAALESRVQESKASAALHEEQARAAAESLAQIQKDAGQTGNLLKERQSALDALNAQFDQKSAALEKLSAELSSAQSRLDQLAARESETASRLHEIDENVAQKQKQSESALEALEAELQAKKDELAQTRHQLDDAKKAGEQADAARARLNTLSTEQSRHETSLRDLKRDLTTAEEQLASARKKLAAENSLLEAARSQRAEAESELEEIREQAAVLTEDGTHAIKPKSSRSMIVLRLFLFGFPFAILALASWAADQSRRAHLMRSEGVVAMLATEKPALHPYAPRTEVERQIIDLVHEPLMRIGSDGALQPALAELWRWSQDVTCWFADEKTAKAAQERLQAQIGEKNRWAEWQLSTVRLVSSTLVLNFSDPTRAGTPQALEVIADLKPQTVAFWRVETQEPVKASAQRFLAESPLAPQIRRVWFDRDNAFEIVVVGPAQKLLDDLRSYIASSVKSEVRMGLMGEVGALSEPVLDLDMRQGQAWHDGTPVTAWDVKTTIEQVNRRPWLLPNREALRHIQEMDIQNGGNRLRVVFRSRYGPALCGWAGLPVLPASWWRDHERDDDLAFANHPPPGAGAFRMQHLDARTLSLTPVSTVSDSPRFLFHFNASPLMTEIGLSTKTTHLLWPAGAHDGRHELLPCLTPPHRRLVVLWNTKSPVLSDVRTRQAAAMITDVPALIAALPGRHTVSDASLFPPGMWLHTRSPRVPHSSAEAKKQLAAAQWLPGVDGIARKDGRKLEFSLLLASGDPVSEKTASLLAAQWRALGAEIRVERLATPDLLAQRLAERKFDAVLVEQRFEVSWDQFPWWHSSQAKPGGTNFAGIEDPQTDLLLEALATEFEPSAAGERVRQLEARLLPQQPMLPLFNTVDDAAVGAALVNHQPRTSWTLREIAFKPKKTTPSPASFELKLPVE
ncbi:MAG: FHA domain-containing protein, partial [Verrucomicrobiaceae bacterium]|nr:FHA domain-containing protein [Verrucomicrobiaceae bacterium]